ncbi:protein ripply2-like [Halichoeres trimaculatus]|uniref:protein ripply2-like n=1 Tax=Halichoeres trimaculatus TaxID=147232 RepID=UPI003D9E5A4B
METLGDACESAIWHQQLGPLINRSFLVLASHPLRTLSRTHHYKQRGNMETFTANSGLTSVLTGINASQRPGRLWRPWTVTAGDKSGAHEARLHGDLSATKHPKTPQVVHPVKLYWPKSRCFDYLYQDAEMLLRNYPVQATICPYEDSSSDEDSDDEEEEMEKELN